MATSHFTTVFPRSFNCLPDGQKIFNLHKKFPEKNYFFFNFFIEKTKKKISAEIFFRFFSKIMRYVFIWVFPDFLDTLYCVFKEIYHYLTRLTINKSRLDAVPCFLSLDTVKL
jgi:hypothetical protein